MRPDSADQFTKCIFGQMLLYWMLQPWLIVAYFVPMSYCSFESFVCIVEHFREHNCILHSVCVMRIIKWHCAIATNFLNNCILNRLWPMTKTVTLYPKVKSILQSIDNWHSLAKAIDFNFNLPSVEPLSISQTEQSFWSGIVNIICMDRCLLYVRREYRAMAC